MTKRQAEGLAFLVTLSWGTAFLFMKMGLEDLAPNSVLFLRPGVAFLVTLPLLIRNRIKMNKNAIIDGGVMGTIMTALFIFILNGLPYTTSTNAGFLISLTVVFVSIFEIVKKRALPERRVMAGLLLSVCGVGLLTLQGGLGAVGFGDFMCIIGAILNATLICYTNYAVKRSDPLVVGILQLGVSCVLGFLVALGTDTVTLPTTPRSVLAIVMLGVVCSGFGFVMQPVVQRYTSPTRTGIIFALEPSFTALLGTLVLREPFTIYSGVGAVLAFLGVLVSTKKEENVKEGN